MSPQPTRYRQTGFIAGHFVNDAIVVQRRMHSSRMHTGHSLTVCQSLLLPGGICSRGICSGGCLLPVGGGVSALGGCLLQGVSAPGGLSALGEVVCSQDGCVVSQHALRQMPPPVNRITDMSKNITLATTLLRPVIIGNSIHTFLKKY